MAKKLSSVLGIDIGSHSIKVAEVKTSGNSATVTAIGVVPTPEGAVDYSGVYNSDEVGKALAEALKASGASSSSAVVTIAGQQSVLVRVLPVPRMDVEKELQSHMEWEISKNIPFAETTIQSDYKVIEGGDPNSAEMEVVMAMAPQSAIDTIVDCIKKAGKKPYAIDVEPIGLGRSLKSSFPQWAGENGVCIVDIGHSTTSINIYDQGNLVLPRPVPGGGEMVTRALADAKQIGVQEAEDYKVNRFSISEEMAANQGFANPFGGATQAFDSGFAVDAYAPVDPVSNATAAMSPLDELAIDPITGLPIEQTFEAAAPTYANDPFSSSPAPESAFAADNLMIPAVAHSSDEDFGAVQGILEDLVGELQRSIDYYAGRGGNVSRVVLCGGGSKLRGLSGYLSRSLNTSVELYDAFNGLGFAAKKVGMDYVNEYRQDFAVAIGNGLYIAY
ncbi:MAG: type IV pilus assembly protein PilM [Armatimonadota bacterium]